MAELGALAARIHALVKRDHHVLRLVTTEEAEARQACVDVAMQQGLPFLLWDTAFGVHDGIVADATPIPNTQQAEAGLRYLAQAPQALIIALLDVTPHLRDDPRALRAWRGLVQKFADRAAGGSPAGALIMIDHDGEPPAIVRAFCTDIDIDLPKGEEVHTILRSALRAAHRQGAIEIRLRTSELEAIQNALHGLNRRQIERVVKDVVADDKRLDAADLAAIISAKRRMLEGDGPLESVEAPASLDDIGGLANLKNWLKQRERALSRDASSFGISPPRGVLLLGVQGAGKSLCAKAIATAWGRPLLRLDAGGLYDKFIGESEKRLRGALRQAEAMAPVILWIDEIEKAFAGASSQSSDGGLSRRMFGALLTWMQEHRAPVFLVATANDIEALPPELLRKGRFDEIFFVDLPPAAVREQILSIHLKKRARDAKAFDLKRLSAATDGFSGAEIEQAVIGGLYEAFAAGREVTTDDIERAAQSSPPLSRTRAEQVEALRQWGRERCKMAE